MPIADQKRWEKFVDLNGDSYGLCCVKVAKEIMRLLDTPEHAKPLEKYDTHNLLLEAEGNIGESGISGFQASAIAHMVWLCHSRGQEFHESWNAMYSLKEQRGTINPALVCLRKAYLEKGEK